MRRAQKARTCDLNHAALSSVNCWKENGQAMTLLMFEQKPFFCGKMSSFIFTFLCSGQRGLSGIKLEIVEFGPHA
jgi:hypothetical protein